jgi:hypothetical protein
MAARGRKGIRANDLVAWQTEIGVRDAEAAERRLREDGVEFLSPGLVRLPEAALGFRADAGRGSGRTPGSARSLDVGARSPP